MLELVVSFLLTGESVKTPELTFGPRSRTPIVRSLPARLRFIKDAGPGDSERDAGPNVSAGTSLDQGPERIVEVRIQGNYRTPEAEVLRLAAIQIGDTLTADSLAAIETRLERSGKFDDIEVRKRWRTIDSTEDIVLVIVVREVPGGSSSPIGRLGRSLAHPLVLPILTYTDGYGLTYGARLSPVNLLGRNLHTSIPLSWGATKEAALELDRPFTAGPLTRATAAIAIRERGNPFYEADDRRLMLSGRAERAFAPSFRVGLSAALSDVAFESDAEPGAPDVFSRDETLATWGADAAFDTRRSTELPRNAVFLQFGWDRLQREGETIDRYRADARGYVGLIGASVLALRAARGDASRGLPPYEQFLLGGAASLRGFRAGYDAGDSQVLGSAELRVPLTSPVSFGRIGASFFADTGAVYAAEERLRDVRFRTGVGAGLFFNAAIFNLDLDVARGLDQGWRVHVSTGLQF